MELKRAITYKQRFNWNVLIVPYGIETLKVIISLYVKHVLIVPYGIETWFKLIPRNKHHVLIVPYGIETISPHRIS